MRTVWASLTISVWLCGCAMEAIPASEAEALESRPYDDDDIGATAQEIRGGAGLPVAKRGGVQAIAGLFSHATGLGEHNCTSPEGGEQQAVRLNSKISWIEQKLGFYCAAKNAGGHPYKQCF